MATSEEKQETIDALKGPRYYRIQLNGYGGESAYMSISKEAHDFWKAQCEEHGDTDLVEYMVNATDEECGFNEITEVPRGADFLYDEGEVFHRPWYESHTEFEHTYGVEFSSAYITVDEVASGDYDADIIREVVDREDLSDYLSKVDEENDYDIQLTEMTCCEEPDAQFIAQMYSSEKGCFFEGTIETTGEFDPTKLKIFTTEYLNGEDTVTSIEYDGVEIDNDGGDTNGKGYYAAVWAN